MPVQIRNLLAYILVFCYHLRCKYKKDMENIMIKLGCHVGMSGKEMFLGSVKEAISYNANTFMIYTEYTQEACGGTSD